MITKEQKEYLLPNAYNAALRAGAAILDIYRSSDHIDIDLKRDNTPIIEADRQAHRVIREYLSQTRIPLLSEEGREMLYTERKDWDLFWMVDPLDGTKEFLKGNGEFTVNISLIVDYKPWLGVIYVPYKEVIYFSDYELGSFRCVNIAANKEADYSYGDIIENVEKLPLTQIRNNPLRIAVSRSHNTPETFEHIEQLKTNYPDAIIIEQGSSYKFCLLAEGSVDYYIRTSDTYEWDTAAGEAILSMAGGTTTGLPSAENLLYNKESLLNPHFICRSRWFRDDDETKGCEL